MKRFGWPGSPSRPRRGRWLRRPVLGGRGRPSFHPLDLGNEALRALLGFIIEGRIQATDLDPEAVALTGFHLAPAHPVTPDIVAEFARTHKRTSRTLGPGGKLIRTDAETT